MLKKIQLCPLVLSAFFLIQPIPAMAELVAQGYGGQSFTQNHNVTVNLPDAGITATHESVQFDNAAVIGGRLAYWMESYTNVGFALDVSHFFGPNQKPQVATTNLCITGGGCVIENETLMKFNTHVTVAALDFMLRYPLWISNKYPRGQLHPYLTVGPAVFITSLEDSGNFVPPGQSSTNTSIGVKAGAGLLLNLTPAFSAFVEYRDTNFQAKDAFFNSTMVNGVVLGSTMGKGTYNVQAVVGGVSFVFTDYNSW